ncbi:uncharacterized protein BO66DRAFT_111380 [Aspergillus aculeatinus CBS 121060]|uniref:Uncharacterized protein n=1 Tax=Aspergillus aculeatinus CBS 121060 TaxID=1448322 RepID=A0ACD1HLP0_9EURO|nr:hypothetical protein BO66DRAFT_111380 [Aspergillus aculeatinus CBS 121060]RAH74602.1 hypothetical protein BO66DRAFT_111380 [Aspergillus aculeatinus CBS 121060]
MVDERHRQPWDVNFHRCDIAHTCSIKSVCFRVPVTEHEQVFRAIVTGGSLSLYSGAATTLSSISGRQLSLDLLRPAGQSLDQIRSSMRDAVHSTGLPVPET